MNRRSRVLAGILAILLLFTALPVTVGAAEGEVFKTEDWIWSTDKVTINSVSYFRKEYTLPSKPTALTIRASAHNHMKYYVNGQLVSGLVTPAPSAPPEAMLYLTYSFTGTELNKLLGGSGTQLCLAAAVQYLGNNGCNYTNGVPAFWSEATVSFANGSEEKLVSGTDWSALAETPYKNETPSMSSHKMNAQTDYDARKMPDALAWTRFGYRESNCNSGTWQKAVKAGKETAAWKLRPQPIPEGVVHENIRPTPVGRQKVGWQVFDAGRVVSGWVRVRLKAPAGTRICIRYSEYLNEDIVHYGVGSRKQTSENYCDYYTFAGTGFEDFAADFDYKAFRYFEIVGMPDLIRPEDISVEWASTGITQTATFSSSDDFLTKLYQACINTQINNVQGMPVDCPHREQAHYLADSQLQYPLLAAAFTGSTELMKKTLLDFSATQLESGRFLYTAPTEQYKKYASIPEWDLRYTDILTRYIELTGDLAGAAEFYDAAVRNVKFHMGMMSRGLLPDESNARNISDHPEKPIEDNPGDGLPLTVVNLLLYDSMNKLSRIAAQLGKAEDAAAWKEKAATLRENINAKLLDKKTHAYKKHTGTSETNPGATAMAINVGVALPEHRDAQLEQLTKTTVKDTSVVLTYEVFRALATYGNREQKQAIYDRTLDSWGQMLKGHETVWEGLTKAHQSSHSHAWSGYPAAFMLSCFLGIDRGEGGAACVTPFLPKDVDEIRGEARVPGTDTTVAVTLRRENGYVLRVNASAAATVAVPRPGLTDTQITVGGTTVFRDNAGSDAKGVRYLGRDSQYVYFAVDANADFEFRATGTEGAQPFTDVKESDWFYRYVTELAADGTVAGMTETTFVPNGTLTYGQALKLIALVVGEKEPQKSAAHWASGWMTLAKSKLWLTEDVNPDAAITRLALCRIAAKAKGLTDQPKKNPFTDTEDAAVLALNKAGVISGMTAKTFEPDGLLTRAQIAKIIWTLRSV